MIWSDTELFEPWVIECDDDGWQEVDESQTIQLEEYTLLRLACGHEFIDWGDGNPPVAADAVAARSDCQDPPEAARAERS
jgi:hypothetical protein